MAIKERKRPVGRKPTLFHLIAENDVQKLLLLLKYGTNVNIRDGMSRTPLMHAVCMARDDVRQAVVKALIVKGANVNAQDSSGRTTLMYACGLVGREDAIAELVNARHFDPNIHDMNGNTAVMHAVLAGNASALHRIVTSQGQHVADPNRRNNKGYTPLSLSVKLGQSECCRVLVNDAYANQLLVPDQVNLRRMLRDDYVNTWLTHNHQVGGQVGYRLPVMHCANNSSPTTTSHHTTRNVTDTYVKLPKTPHSPLTTQSRHHNPVDKPDVVSNMADQHRYRLPTFCQTPYRDNASRDKKERSSINDTTSHDDVITTGHEQHTEINYTPVLHRQTSNIDKHGVASTPSRDCYRVTELHGNHEHEIRQPTCHQPRSNKEQAYHHMRSLLSTRDSRAIPVLVDLHRGRTSTVDPHYGETLHQKVGYYDSITPLTLPSIVANRNSLRAGVC